MQAGITILSGLEGEYEGWEPGRAWSRAVAMREVAERLGFAYAWGAGPPASRTRT